MDSSAVTESIYFNGFVNSFIVSDVDMEEISDTYSHGTISFDVTNDTNENAAEFIGNDSNEYNKSILILNVGRCDKNPRMFEV